MALTIELEVVNTSGDLQQIVLRGTGDGDKVLTQDEILALISAGGGGDEHVKISASDPVAQYIRDKIQAGSGISIVETGDPLGDYITISFSGEVTPSGSAQEQILQWNGSSWVTRNYLTLIPLAGAPKDPNYIYLDDGDKNMKYSDQDEVTSQLLDDKGSINGIAHVWSGTQQQYNDLSPAYDINTLYFIE